MKIRNCGALALLLAAGAVSAGPGQVLVVVKIDSVKFQKGLQQSAGTAEAAIAKKLAAQLQVLFPPLEWTATAPADGAAATFSATLQQDDFAIPNISLHWTAKVGESDLALRDLHDWPVYQVGNVDRPYRNADRLVGDVNTRLTGWLQSDAIEKQLHDEFVKRVPVATRVDLDDNLKAVLIPLSWARAQLGDQSEFRLEFTRAAPLSQIRVLLNGVAERLAGTAQGNTQSIVASCAASGVPVSANVWSDCVAILEQPNAPPLLVSIERYEFAAHLPGVAPNGTAVRP